jgi:uncharacterized protein YecE (DUF72 family)
MAHISIGLSGYSYKPWQGTGRFYPPGLKASEFLRYYGTRYETVELDGLWYRLPTQQAVRSWIEQTPSRFVFSPKAHRRITHFSRLKPEAMESVSAMLDRLAPLINAGKLGPVLLQLPPNFHRDDDRLCTFLGLLPSHIRWAIEFRHASWHVLEVEAMLRAHQVAWCAVETDDCPAERRGTAGFWYVRLRRSAYVDEQLIEWATWLRAESDIGRSCFVYCKHEDEGAPWVWADRLRELVER